MDLTKYYEEICKQPFLSTEEEKELFRIYYSPNTTPKEKANARDQIIRSNLRFVFKKAKQYSKNDPDAFEELILAGNDGLLAGFEKYNPDSNIKFLSYAGWWVMQRQLKEMSRMRIVSLPVGKQQLSVKILKAQENSEVSLSIEDLKTMFPEVSERDIKELMETRYLTYYLDDLEDSEVTVSPIEEEVEEELQANSIKRMLAELPELTAKVIELSFGLDDGKEKKPSQVAAILKLPRKEVKMLREEGLALLAKNKNLS